MNGRLAASPAAGVSPRDGLANPRQLTDGVDVAFFLRALDPPAYLYVSAAFEKIYGFDPLHDGTLTGGDQANVYSHGWEELAGPLWEASRRGEAASGEFCLIRPDGETRWVRATVAPVADCGDAARRCAGAVEDITERKLAETALKAAHDDAERANAAKSEFLSRMSHELRTPMNAVLGFAQLLEMDDLTADQIDSVHHILRGGRHLLGLIDDVLDITKIESDRLDVSPEPVLIAELLIETINLMVPLAASKDVTLRFHPAGTAGQYVRVDRRCLRQVLFSLLSNAAKYNRRGGSIDVRCQVAPGGMFEIGVADTGVGIRAEDLPRLFTPFDRLGAQAGGIDGSGVGLALSQRLMLNMRGSLRAQSELNVGSTFTASVPTVGDHSLPVSQAEPADVVTAPMTAVKGPTNVLAYIEDNSPNVELMSSVLLRRPQWRMVVAGNGALGLELIAASPPDLLFLDLHLPDMDGIEVLRRLRADPRTAGLRVVVISADANRNQIHRLLASGAREYLTKPFDVARILQLLDASERKPSGSSSPTH